MQRTVSGGVTVIAIMLASGVCATPAAALGEGETPAPRIVKGARWLSPTEIQNADITATPAGRAAISAALGDQRQSAPLRSYRFGEASVVVSAPVKLQVVEGQDASGSVVHEVFPIAQGITVSGAAGFISPPNTAFKYNNENQFTYTSGTWIRKIWWQLEWANNYTCTGCGTYDYWRIYGRVQGSTTSGADANNGYKRLWLEFDRTSGFTPYEFEPIKPVESYAGTGNSTTTIGFGANAGIKLGEAPAEATGGLDLSYTGSITKSIENWHPVVRAESGSGGVQWCWYQGVSLFDNGEFTGTRYLTTRASIRHNSTEGGPTYGILHGMQDSYSLACPTQL